MLTSCAPVNISNEKQNEEKTISSKEKIVTIKKPEKILAETNKASKTDQSKINYDVQIKRNITIILSKKDDENIVRQFINIIELAVYQKKLKDISFEIKIYENKNELNSILKNSDLAGRVFIGPLNSADTEILNSYCNEGAVFFSFSSNKSLAKNCVYLINFFPENEIRTLFNFFPKNSKIALLFPENIYGFGVNKIIDSIANESESVIVNRASYSEDLSNASEAIKELGKYELRKYELNRQKKLLANKKDAESKKRLIKLERFQTTQNLDFTHVIIADYGLRLLQVAPLLPYYDIDPDVVRFVGTGAWDDEVFFDEPSLKGSIYPGIEFANRKNLVQDFYNLYEEKLLRTSTLPYDLVGLLSFAIENKYSLGKFYEMLNQSSIKFSGVDGSFHFLNNIIERDLDILMVEGGNAIKVLK